MLKDRSEMKGYTLIEVVIAMIIVAVLSIISVTIYTKYIRGATVIEGKALVMTIASAERIYNAENGAFLDVLITNIEPLLDIDSRMNTYFKDFHVRVVVGPGFVVVTTGEAGTEAAGINIVLIYTPATPDAITINGV